MEVSEEESKNAANLTQLSFITFPITFISVLHVQWWFGCLAWCTLKSNIPTFSSQVEIKEGQVLFLLRLWHAIWTQHIL